MKPASLFFMTIRFLFGRGGSDGAEVSRKSLRGSILGIACSIIPLVVVLQVADGMIEGIISRSVELGSYHATATPVSQVRKSLEDLEADALFISSLPGIKSAFPERQGAGIMVKGDRNGKVILRAVTPDLFGDEGGFAGYITVIEGDAVLKDRNSIILGTRLASSIGVKAGDWVILLSQGTNRKGEAATRLTRFIVEGIISSGYEDLDGIWAFTSIGNAFPGGRGGSDLSSILDPSASDTFIGIKTDSFSMPGILGGRPELPRSLQNGISGYSLKSWYDYLENQLKSLMVTRILLIAITGLILLVATANVFSAVVMLVIERRQEIAILRSMGATRADITLMFTLSGAFIGFAASIIGITAGLFLAVNVNESIRGLEWLLNLLAGIGARAAGGTADSLRLLDPSYYLQDIPIRIGSMEVIYLALATIILCGLAAWIPARAAGRTEPLEVMRKS